jgi:MFS family permease
MRRRTGSASAPSTVQISMLSRSGSGNHVSSIVRLSSFSCDAFVIAGVLPSIASTLKVSTASAGQLVTVFSLAYAVAAPILGALTAGWSRRTALVVALIVFALGNAVTAVAPDFSLVPLSRVIAAAGAGLFTATASATAAALAGPQNRGRAIALVMLGLTSSLILGAAGHGDQQLVRLAHDDVARHRARRRGRRSDPVASAGLQ